MVNEVTFVGLGGDRSRGVVNQVWRGCE